MSNDVLTLQFGPLSNHISTHYYNIQQTKHNTSPLTSSPFFMERKEGMIVPRCIMIDTKRNTLGKTIINNMNSKNTNTTTWNDVEVIDKSLKNTYFDQIDSGNIYNEDGLKTSKEIELDNVIDYWSEYNKVYYHEKSSHIIPSTATDSIAYDLESKKDLNNGLQDSWFWSNDISEDLFEKIRFFLEISDNLNGIQILVDVFSEWGNVTKDVMECLRDDYIKTNIVTWCIDDIRTFPDTTVGKILSKESKINTAMNLYHLSQDSNLTSLLKPPLKQSRFTRVEWNVPWETSSVYASIFETIHTPWYENGMGKGIPNLRQTLVSMISAYPAVDKFEDELINFSDDSPGIYNGKNGIYRGNGRTMDEMFYKSRESIPIYEAYPQHFQWMDSTGQISNIRQSRVTSISMYVQYESRISGLLSQQLNNLEGEKEYEQMIGWYQDELEYYDPGH